MGTRQDPTPYHEGPLDIAREPGLTQRTRRLRAAQDHRHRGSSKPLQLGSPFRAKKGRPILASEFDHRLARPVGKSLTGMTQLTTVTARRFCA